MLVHTGLVYFVREVKPFTSIALVYHAKEIKKFIGNKKIKGNISLVQASNSILCSYYCIGFINFMPANKKLTDFTSMFSPYDFEKTDQTDWSDKMQIK